MHRSLAKYLATALLPLLGLSAVNAAEGKPQKKTETPKSVVVFRLRQTLQEAPVEDPFSLSAVKPVTLKDLVARMKKAQKDDAVEAVVLLHDGGNIGTAQIEELRQSIAGLRSAGKDVYANADSLSMKEYVLLSGVSRLSLVPTAELNVTGLYAEAPYVRGLLDLIGVKPDFLTCGAYKSAAEIFMRESPSPEAEKMENWLLDSIYDTFVGLIAKGRGVDAAKVKEWIDGGPYSAERAKATGLIDAVEQRQDFAAFLKSKYGKDVVFDKSYGEKKPPKINFDNPFAMFKVMGELLGEGKKPAATKKSVAIVYVDGAITIGGGPTSVFDEGRGAKAVELRRALDEAADDNSIKAVVLRIDSPGGSAVASEIILDATRRVKAKKPFVVSMGDVAGSGGYYVACAADVIFADEATITGSIGVVSGKLATKDMFKKVGISFKDYRRGANAGMLNGNEVFTPEERKRMQEYMDEIYGVFKGHVVAIRGNKLKKPIDELAGGRVYTGRQALDLGLVDRIGSLEDTITYAAGQAHVSDYDVRVVPAPKNFLEKLMEELSGEKEEGKGLDTLTRPPVRGTGTIMDLAAPYLKHLDPQRFALVRRALGRLELIRQEGAVLMMPELSIGR